jgi:hypothetical protein
MSQENTLQQDTFNNEELVTLNPLEPSTSRNINDIIMELDEKVETLIGHTSKGSSIIFLSHFNDSSSLNLNTDGDGIKHTKKKICLKW